MWRAPTRPSGEITQPLNDGVATIYEVISNEAAPGLKPRPALRQKAQLLYAERRMGLQRLWTGQQAQTQYEHLIRVQRGVPVAVQDVVVLTGSDVQYRVELVQTVPDVWPACLDLTLSRILPGYPMEEVADDG